MACEKQDNPRQATITILTIGFTKKSAQEFFTLLQDARVKRLIDVRLLNTSHLNGFTKRDDLKYFLWEIAKIEYIHRLDLAPTKEILDSYKKAKEINWPEYEQLFLKLMEECHAENVVTPGKLNGSSLLCSEPKADKCHRRLVVEYLQARLGNVKIIHL